MSYQAVTASRAHRPSLSRLLILKSCKSICAADRDLSHAVLSWLDWKLQMQIIQQNTKIILLLQQKEENYMGFSERVSHFSKESIKQFASQAIHTFWIWLLLQFYYFFTEKKFVTREKYLLCIHYFDKKLTKSTNRIKGIGFLTFVIK